MDVLGYELLKSIIDAKRKDYEIKLHVVEL